MNNAATLPHIVDSTSNPAILVQSNTENMSASINEIATALASAQSELESAKKDSSGYGYNYSDLSSVIATAKPVLAKNNLAITQLVGNTNENVTITTILTHSSGQYFKSTSTLPVIEMKGCNVAQSAGASISYLRRYSYQAILGMSSEDNDASSNGPTTKKAAAPKKAPPAKKKTSFARNPVKEDDDDL